MFDLNALAEFLVEQIDNAVAQSTSTLRGQVEALNAELAVLRGRSTDERRSPGANDIAAMVQGEVAQQLAALPAPEPGKDADPEVMRQLVTEEVTRQVSELPTPRDGQDVDSEDLQRRVDEAVAKAVETLPAPEPGRDADPEVTRRLVTEEVTRQVSELPPARDGQDVDPEDLQRRVDEAVAKTMETLPAPEPGRDADPEVTRQLVNEEVARQVSELPPARDGQDVDPEDLQRRVDEAVAKAVETLPAPEPGKDADPEVTRQLVTEEVTRQVSELPPPRDGQDVDPEDLQRRVDEAVAKAVETLPTPKDGVGLAGAVIDRAGELVVTLSNGEAVKLGRVVGQDGKSAFGDIDFDATLLEDGRTLTFSFGQGDVVQTVELEMAWPLDRGVWREGGPDGKGYAKGDGVSWGGEFYIAQVSAPEGKPGVGGAWRRATKKGQDGKDFDPNAKAKATRDPRIKS